jgi:hypothetical protein
VSLKRSRKIVVGRGKASGWSRDTITSTLTHLLAHSLGICAKKPGKKGKDLGKNSPVTGLLKGMFCPHC